MIFADVSEKIIRKLRLGMMPPPGMKRPDEAVLSQFASSLEAKVDAAAAMHPNPGRRGFQRLNRAEYTHSVRDLLDLDIDVNAFLPPDTMSAGYDNIADVQTFSATLMEGYLRAAARISTLAVGDRNASPSEFTVKVPRTESQMRHVEGTPWGTWLFTRTQRLCRPVFWYLAAWTVGLLVTRMTLGADSAARRPIHYAFGKVASPWSASAFP